MEFEDFLEPEIAVTAAVAAALFSPRGRNWIRRGLVYGTAGALIAGDTINSFAQSIGRGMQQANGSTQEETTQSPPENPSTEGSGGS